MDNIIPVIICGGEGNRLWPISGVNTPKQFIPMFNKKSLFEITLLRVSKISSLNPIVVSSMKNKNIIKKICKKLNIRCFLILEEIGRNTSAAIWFAAKFCNEKNLEGKLFITPCDHYISKEKKLTSLIYKASKLTSEFNWILFGIKPTSP